MVRDFFLEIKLLFAFRWFFIEVIITLFIFFSLTDFLDGPNCFLV
jgi:hypothetical protein